MTKRSFDFCEDCSLVLEPVKGKIRCTACEAEHKKYLAKAGVKYSGGYAGA